ncbi:MAG: DEAD/DEAH box helicase [Peptococcaceae bacterium]|nr:DEAD/DEAH box helicase [Peptococcaceae bacterium]
MPDSAAGQRDNGNRELVALLRRDGFRLDWQATKEQLDDRQIVWQQNLHEMFRDNADKSLFHLGFSDSTIPLSDSVHFLRVIALTFAKCLAKNPDLEISREKTIIKLELPDVEHILHSAPFMNGLEYLDAEWVGEIWRRLSHVFSEAISAYSGDIAGFFASLGSVIHPVGRVFFHLVESNKDEYPFAFLTTYSSAVSSEGRPKHLPLKNALIEYKNDNNKLLHLLSTVNKASQKSAFIAGIVDSGEIFHPLGLTSNEAYTFLVEIPLYEEAGILCRMPNWWKNKSNSPGISVTIGDKAPSRLGFDALVDFNVQLSLGGETITPDELRRLLSESEGLALIKGKWVEVNHEKLKETLRAYEQARALAEESDMGIMEAMRFQLNASKIINVHQESCDLEVTNGQWLGTVISRLTHPAGIPDISGGEDFHATLRGYQRSGLAWLNLMKTLGLGACLADDMGLGKTVQVIALLNHIRNQGREKTLLVVPASLIANWLNEIVRFAPSLSYCVLHPSENKSMLNTGADLLDEFDLFITTYGMLTKYDWLKEVTWNSLILDEAQAIKNPGTKQTRAVKQIKSRYKIAMTGTPIENRLSELWSLFDFLNKGLLGTAGEFTRFTKQLKENQEGYSRLKKVVGPFILRRLKTDTNVISDLPDKIEMKTFSTLTRKQAALYDAQVRHLETRLASAGGIERKGLILSSIMKFKQICNHPDQYLGQSCYAENESGKYARLREICETIYEKRERVLVFTQFKEITGPLQEFLESVFQHQGLVLHGETAVRKRKDIVDTFQGDEYVPFLVLSLKAGGVGLNLTAANHVVHFDRWWNPAVENQATDRAFRIGQRKSVIVHKFITRGTIEEKIDLMIEEKSQLTREIIPDIQENWLTEMNNEQLMDLFRLSV